MVFRLCTYNKNGNVKATFITPEGYALENWLYRVRRGKYKITEEQRECLIECGFVWKN